MGQILYYSTNQKAEKVSFREALIKGQAPDKGLYMPEQIPVFSKNELSKFKSYTYPEIAFNVASKFLTPEEVATGDLKEITEDAYNFEVPLENVFDKHYIMRLDQGPTASFKDFAARMMGRLMQYFLDKENREMLILTATSGDTGSAIANAFYGLDNIKVVILFPENEVSDRQRKQMTTLGKNIQIIGIDGKFDDCQAYVKQAFADEELNHLGLSSANSINIGRLIPQSMYYFYAWSRLAANLDEKITFSVPSGNFGDLMGGLIAKQMGLPVERFIVSTNANNEVPVYLQTNIYNKIEPSKNCISSAMNVGHPSNLARIIALYGGVMDEGGNVIKEPNVENLRNNLWGISIDDEETKATIKKIYSEYNILLEPHGSVGWSGLEKYLQEKGDNKLTVTLETAHPAKFPREIRTLLNIDPELPESLKNMDEKEERFVKMETKYDEFKKYLISNYS